MFSNFLVTRRGPKFRNFFEDCCSNESSHGKCTRVRRLSSQKKNFVLNLVVVCEKDFSEALNVTMSCLVATSDFWGKK